MIHAVYNVNDRSKISIVQLQLRVSDIRFRYRNNFELAFAPKGPQKARTLYIRCTVRRINSFDRKTPYVKHGSPHKPPARQSVFSSVRRYPEFSALINRDCRIYHGDSDDDGLALNRRNPNGNCVQRQSAKAVFTSAHHSGLWRKVFFPPISFSFYYYYYYIAS